MTTVEILKEMAFTATETQRRALEDAISALSENKGEWIADIDKWGDVVTTVNGYTCSKCGTFNSDKDNFCPNCGADMRKAEKPETCKGCLEPCIMYEPDMRACKKKVREVIE